MSQTLSGISTATVTRYALTTKPAAAAVTPSDALIRGIVVTTIVPVEELHEEAPGDETCATDDPER